jgi:DNA-binding LacI/PurR family transcriptional regulator
LTLLRNLGIPFAVLGNGMVGPWSAAECDFVEFDDLSGSHEMTRYLQSLGHQDIWYVGNTHWPWFARRYEGYARAMQEEGLRPRKSEIDSNNDREIGYLSTKALLAARQPVSALFAGSDQIAEGVYKALRDCGLKVPESISVAGFNDLEAALLDPPLTTVNGFPEVVGSHLVRLLLKRIETSDSAPQHFIIPTQLVRRESCQAMSSARLAPVPAQALAPPG